MRRNASQTRGSELTHAFLALDVDISGRIRKGPAPVRHVGAAHIHSLLTPSPLQLNLEVPEYSFSDDEKIIIG